MRLNDRGDTIIEVMISILALTTVLGAAYGLASRSLQGTRAAEERGQATKLAESQMEGLKKNATSSFANNATFCIDRGDGRTPRYNIAADCTQGIYKYSIHHLKNTAANPGPPTEDQFVLSVQWDRIGGGSETLKIVYRKHF